MSNKREREKRREERLREETQVDSGERRRRLLQSSAGAVFLVAVAVVALIVINSGGDSGGDAANIKDVAEVEQSLGKTPQKGLVLGSPSAKVQLIEYGDLQCPVCKQYAEVILPPLIDSSVKSGKATLEFRNFTIIGPQSGSAGIAALAAGEQGRGWQFLELFYHNQGRENSGYATDAFLTAVAKAAGVQDLAKWNEDRKSAKLKNKLTAENAEAQKYGLTGTPSFAIKGPATNGIELLGTPGSPQALEEAIESAS
jgi:protein-disulfide isomerase